MGNFNGDFSVKSNVEDLLRVEILSSFFKMKGLAIRMSGEGVKSLAGIDRITLVRAHFQLRKNTCVV